MFCERNGCAAFTYNKQTGVCIISDCPATVGDPGVNTKTFECKMHYFDIKQKKMGGQKSNCVSFALKQGCINVNPRFDTKPLLISTW